MKNKVSNVLKNWKYTNETKLDKTINNVRKKDYDDIKKVKLLK